MMSKVSSFFWEKRLGTLLFAMWAIAVFSPVATATETRSLTLNGSGIPQPVTDVVINGVQTSALLDTGATIPLIGARYFQSQVRPTHSEMNEQSEARIVGIGGQKLYPISRLPVLSVGDATWTNLRVAVNPENRFPVQKSILPISLFETRIVDFDFANERVHFYDGKPKRVRRTQRASVSYLDVNQLIFIPVKVNGVRGHALIDTGADVSFMNPAFADQSRAKLNEARTAILKGSDLTRNRAEIFDVRRIVFAKHEFNDVFVPVIETELFAGLGFGDQPMMVFGMDLLQHFRVQVDRDRQKVYFTQSND